jgi:hypothetical protein
MTRVGEVSPKVKEMNEARDRLLRELERLTAPQPSYAAADLLQRIERFIDAKIATQY